MAKRFIQRSIACLVAAAMLFSSVSMSFAQGASSYKKQEVVYVNLESNGNIKDIYVVNIFDLNKAGEIVDYGDYEELRNMTTNDKIQFSKETVRVNTNESSLYYEARLKGNATPWKFDIHYYLDGKELSADELAGKSGKLKIALSIAENDEKYLDFFQQYALQMQLQLDSKLASNIESEGATIANVGRMKQLTYIVLPGFGGEYEITADVNNFEMDGFQINGIKMNLGLDEDVFMNNSLLTSSLKQLEDGARRLDAGAAAVLAATAALAEGTKSLASGIDELYDGAVALSKGADSLYLGLDEFAGGAHDLYSGAKELASNSPTLNLLSDLIYNSNIEDSRSLLRRRGYDVDEYTDLDTLKAFLEKRQAELLGDDGFMYIPTREALLRRLTEVDQILDRTTEGSADYEYYTLAKQYLLLSLFGLDLENAGDELLDQYDVIATYSDFLLEIEGLNVADELYQRYTVDGMDPKLKEIGDSEYAIIYSYVEALMMARLCSDPVYKALAVLVYCKGVKSFTAGVDSIYSGAYQLYSGAGDLEDGAFTLSAGAKTLSAGIGTVSVGANELYAGTIQLKEGCVQLKDGTEELLVNVSSSSKVFVSKIMEAVEAVFGGEFAPRSYVDERNDEVVDMVQFVFNFDGVEIPDIAVNEAVTVKLTFWQKLLKLFGVEY